MTNVRMRDTFMKVGQSLLVKRQLVMEKQLKEKMIHSVMPPKVSDWLITGGVDDEDDFDIDSETGSMMRKVSSPRSSNQGDIRKNLFRPFNMNATENVSILFADIVGFTKMSSNKSASQLVGLLNDLFGRFDRMCSQCNCEKISTLGDCYYCVSGECHTSLRMPSILSRLFARMSRAARGPRQQLRQDGAEHDQGHQGV